MDLINRRAFVSIVLAGSVGFGLAVPALAAGDQAGDERPRAAEGTPVVRVIKENGWTLKLNLRTQRLVLSAAPEGTITNSAEVSPANQTGGFVSAGVLAAKAKQFDDGLVAAINLAAQSGCGRLKGKDALLKTLATRLNGEQFPGSNVQDVILAAAKLGKVGVRSEGTAGRSAQVCIDKFMSKSEASKPVSFYTWSPKLGNIFRQDRMLQTPLEGAGGIHKLVDLMRSDPLLSHAYMDQLKLNEALTNPFRAPSLREYLEAKNSSRFKTPERNLAIFPASRSHEDLLVKQLFDKEPVPRKFNLLSEMISRIQSGEMSLKPVPDSGWYDYQSWALEPLVIPRKMPEAAQVNFTEGYCHQLLELFKGLISLSRETQNCPLPFENIGGGLGGMEIEIYPSLCAEPLSTYYYRRALGYNFVRKKLEQSIGAPALRHLHRLREKGQSSMNLLDELKQMERLFSGAYLAVSENIGTDPAILKKIGGAPIPQANAAYFHNWAVSAKTDPDVNADVRMMVPVFRDKKRNKTKVWLFMGWIHADMHVEWGKRPAVMSLMHAPAKPGEVLQKPELVFKDLKYEVVYPLTAEVYVDKVLNRDEFRKLCDRNNNCLPDVVFELTGKRPMLFGLQAVEEDDP